MSGLLKSKTDFLKFKEDTEFFKLVIAGAYQKKRQISSMYIV